MGLGEGVFIRNLAIDPSWTILRVKDIKIRDAPLKSIPVHHLYKPAASLQICSEILLDVPFWTMFFSVSKMVLIPLIAGILINRYFHQRVKPIEKVFPAISTTFITFVCALVIALNNSYLPQINLWIFLAVILLNLAGLSIGYYIGYFSKFSLKRKRALSIEIGMQNAGMGVVLALSQFKDTPETALPGALFAVWCILTAAGATAYLRHRTGPQARTVQNLP